MDRVCSLHGGCSNFNVLKERCEHGIHGVDYLDKIKDFVVFDDTHVKKLYKYKPEIKDVASLKNIVSNSALSQFAPLIVSELNKIYNSIAFSNPFDYVRTNYSGIEDILPGGKLLVFWNRLSVDDKNLLFNELT